MVASGNERHGEGYMADVYHIDGQALEPTAFGRYNDQGVWVPREVDFTPAEMRNSDFLTADGGFMADTATGGGATYAFNGNLEQRATTNNGNALVTFAPVPAIDFTDGVEVMVRSNSNVTLNGGAAIATNAGESGVWTELATGAGSINTITAQCTNGSTTAVYGFRINPGTATEQILANPFIYSAGVTSSTGAFDTGMTSTPDQAFDGRTDTECRTSTAASSSLTFNFNPAIQSNTSIRLFVRETTETINWDLNSGAVTGSIDGATDGRTWVEINTGELELSQLVTTGTRGGRVAGIEIDGQVLVDGVNGSYGPNGFHLDFADPNDLGADRSGNGNDFTATGFNTQLPGIWSSTSAFTFQGSQSVIDNGPTAGNLASTEKEYNSGAQPIYGFDDSNSNAGTEPGQAWVFRPPTPLTNVSSIRIWALGDQKVWVNGNDSGISTVTATWNDVYNGSPITVETLSGLYAAGDTYSASSTSSFARIEINGQVLRKQHGRRLRPDAGLAFAELCDVESGSS